MIEVGDWVMVIRTQPCCGFGLEELWKVFQVEDIVTDPQTFFCTDCGMQTDVPIAIGPPTDGFVEGFRLSRLLKIPPKKETQERKIENAV